MLLTRLNLVDVAEPLQAVLPRPLDAGADVRQAVAEVLADVRGRGDEALAELTARFDGVELASFSVDPAEVADALRRVPPELAQALRVAYRRITASHAHDCPPAPAPFESEGVTVRHLVRPVERAGIYAPGGRARYPSTVLMCAAPARVAGVQTLVLCAPPGRDGRIDDATLAAAAVSGVEEVYAVGGAQAIGAMAFGTRTIGKVDVIVGPGNRYVAEAKRQVSGAVGIASAFAGPSEVVVVAGPEAPAELAAVDLVVQAEHGPDGLAWLVTWSPELADRVEAEVARLVAASSRRADLERTLSTNGYSCLVADVKAALAVADVVAPEHLELMVQGAEDLLPLVHHAGAVFCGWEAPASLGDYLAGPNHVLPTDRTARFASALRADDFRRHLHAVSATPAAVAALAPYAITLAEAEGLPAHAESLRLRTQDR